MIIFMKTARLFMILLIGTIILFSGCNNDDDPVTYTVTVTNDANGTAEADKATAEAGTIVKLTATAADGYIFEKWTVESGDITLSPDATTNPATFTMPANAVSVKAEFAAMPPDTYTITVTNDGNGTAKATIDDAEVTESLAGNTVTLTATPNTGYVLSKWTVESGGITFTDETANPATFTMPANAVSVKAEFAEVPKQYSIYLAISYNNAAYDMYISTLVNGVQTDLLPQGGSDAFSGSMTVSGGKTYVAASYFASSNGVTRACYWVDGAFTKLDGPVRVDETEPDHAQSIVVSDGKAYVAGLYMNNYKAVPCYWVDGVLNTLTLPDGASFGATYSIVVSGGKVYAAGYSYGSTRTPGYWDDGVFVPLDIPAGATFQVNDGGIGIAVADKVYVMGSYKLDSKNYPCVWADGTRTELSFDASANGGAIGKSMTVSGGKVYVSGYSVIDNRYKACFWVDGVRTDLDPPAGMYSMGNSIGVIDGKVYVGGSYFGTSYDYKPCYWFDGERTDLDIPTGGTQASIISMYVSE